MEQESLFSYIKQVYNPGSPNPNPCSDPLKSFSTESSPYNAIVNSENPLKITLSAIKRKRASESDLFFSPPSSPPIKRVRKMNKEEIDTMTESLLQRFISAQDKSSQEIKDSQDNLKHVLQEEMVTVRGKIDTLAKQQEVAADVAKKDKEETDTRLNTMEKQITTLMNQQPSQNAQVDQGSLESAVKNYVDHSSDSSWKANLAQEVFNHDHGIVVHGYRFIGSDDNAKKNSVIKFLKEELKASKDMLARVKVREVVRLGADDGTGKAPPVLIKFSHPTERNLLLPLSRNLRKEISIDKNIPKKYQAKHKEFKKLAWKLKTVHNVKSQVIFDSFNLVLRYKKHDDGVTKYNWIIEKEYHPKPGDVVTTQNRAEARDPNKHDSPAIDTSSTAECNKTIIVTKVCDTIDRTNASMEFMTYFATIDHIHLVKVDFKSKGTVVITCRDWAGCKVISDTYEKVKFLNKDIVFTLFSETDPSA